MFCSQSLSGVIHRCQYGQTMSKSSLSRLPYQHHLLQPCSVPSRRQITRPLHHKLQAKTRPNLYDVDVKPTIDVALTDEYAFVLGFWEEHRKNDTTAQRRKMLVFLIIRAMSQHLVKKEMVFYPAVREKLGDAMADKALAACQAVKKKLLDLDAASPDAPGYDMQLEVAMKDVVKHIQDDKQLLKTFAAAAGVDPMALDRFGIDFWWTTYLAPSRPHPELPNRPPFDQEQFKSVRTADFKRDSTRFHMAVY